MLLSAVDKKVPPRQISFKGTLQNLNNFLPLLVRCMPLDAGLLACVLARRAIKRG